MQATDRPPLAAKGTSRLPVVSAICVLAALALLVLSVPAFAGGRNDVYVGEIEQPAAHGFNHSKTIELYVHTQHHRDGTVTINIPVVNVFDVYASCPNGTDVSVGFNAGGVTSRLDIRGTKVKRNRSFEASGIWGELDGFKLKGTLPAHGAATGTLEVTEEPTVAEVGEGEREHFPRCESGLLDWSAPRK